VLKLYLRVADVTSWWK